MRCRVGWCGVMDCSFARFIFIDLSFRLVCLKGLSCLFSHLIVSECMKGSSDDERYEPSPEADEEAMKIARIKLVSYWDEVFKETNEEEGPDEWFVDFQTLEPLLRLGENMRILVAGCGFSALGIELAKRGHQVVNLDISRYKEEWES